MTTPTLEHVWPEWQIEKQIGRGTYGTVWQAVRHSGELTSRAAVKVISIPQDPYELEALRSDGLDLQSSHTYLKRIVDDFVSEIRLMETFKGIQNIVSIEDYKVIEKTDVLGWDIFIRMELLTPFSTYLCDRKLTEQDVIRLGCDICTALEICAQRSIIHRDIKPENIFVNSFGSFKLGDFGTARNMESLTGGLSQKGTFNYMAPEVIGGNPYDARVDVYSLGLVLYRLLNGNRLPFISEKQLLSPGERRNAFDRRIRGEALPPPCEASPELAKVILKACAFRPEDRYESAAQLRQALFQVIAGTPSRPKPAPAAAPAEAPAPEAAPKPKARKPKENNSGPAVMSVNAPAMSISAPTFSDTPVKRSPFRKLLAAALVLALLVLSCTIAYLAGSGSFSSDPKGTVKAETQATSAEQTDAPTRQTEPDPYGIPTGLSVVSFPNKTFYTVGESFDPTGLMLEVTYDDGSVRNITEGFSYLPGDFPEAGTYDVIISYKDVSTTISVLAVNDSSDILQDFPFNNLLVTLEAPYYTDTLEGCNQNGVPVNRCVYIEFDMLDIQLNAGQRSISCSWGKVETISYEPFSIEDSKKGITFVEYATISGGYNPGDKDRFAFLLMLPDDPSIEGEQTITVQVGQSTKEIHLTLVYLGDYDTGLGWTMTDVRYD